VIAAIIAEMGLKSTGIVSAIRGRRPRRIVRCASAIDPFALPRPIFEFDQAQGRE
jgi:hypothetical protein